MTMFIATAHASIFVTWLSNGWRVTGVTMERLRSVYGVSMENGRRNLGTMSGQCRDNLGTALR